jgi:hypothetical protein
MIRPRLLDGGGAGAGGGEAAAGAVTGPAIGSGGAALTELETGRGGAGTDWARAAADRAADAAAQTNSARRARRREPLTVTRAS